MRLRAEHLTELAAGIGLDPMPAIPELVQWVPAEDFAAAQAVCLQGEGWDVVYDAEVDAVVANGVTASQQAAYELSQWMCQARFSADPRAWVPLSEKQLGMVYDYYASTLVPCLESHGYAAPPLPTREVFVSEYGKPTMWHPSAFLSAEDRATLESACPLSPGLDSLWQE